MATFSKEYNNDYDRTSNSASYSLEFDAGYERGLIGV